MTWQELQKQALQLPIGDRWRLVQLLLSSIQKETLVLFSPPIPNTNSLTGLDPWTQSLIGVIKLGTEDPTESYVDYLEEKYS
ncbi:hypothetical protein [Synechococcus sp. PCC 7336]|uniref:hypothetical protein n=1 Tax=Synechococcus sp. PCC 7336 TaxID=195250 RepID=UPI0003462BE0|nr:hypothetical protein [Synechococcus sp. PCC 7336]